MSTNRTLRFGERVTGALLGVDALYRTESGDDVGLVVLNLDTDGAYAPEPFATYDAAARRFADLLREAGRLPERDRRLYYDQLCHSTLSFIRWRDRGLPFDARLRDFLHVPAEPVADGELEEMRAGMRALLDGLGYRGNLEAQCMAWERRNQVAPDEAEAVLANLMAEAWTRTEELLFEIPAPRSDGMKVRAVRRVPFNARCDYRSRTVDLNVDPVLTRPGLKHLAVHEGCPGHYVQFKLRETLHRGGEAPADVLLSVVNTASSSVFEGIADTGLAMIRWAENDDDRLQALLNRYRAAIGIGAAWRLHAEGWPEERVADWLRARHLVGGEGWVQNRMAFLSAPSRAVLIWSYWWGERSVRPVWERIPEARRPGFLRFLYGRMHSTATVSMFED